MSLLVDETAGDLPVRDVGLMRGGLMPAVPDALHDVKAWKRHLMKTKDPQSLFRLPKEHLEDLCVKLRDENSILRQHARTQEQKLRRMSTRFMRLRQQGSNGLKERDMEDTIQELEARVDLLETQKGALQNKLGLAKQHIMDLGGRTPYKSNKGKSAELEGGIRRATHTAPPRYGPMLEDPRTELEKTHRRSSVVEQLRIAELVQAAQALRDTLRDKEKEMEGTAREVRKQQTDKLRISIKENIDSIRLQKQLSEKNVSLAVLQEKFNNLHETYENQLEETQRSLKETQAALLQRVDEVTEQLKQERQRALELEGHLTTSNLSLQNLDKLQERISDLEGERDLIKENYNTLLESTLSVQSKHDVQMEKSKEEDQKRDRMELYRLEERLQTEREERNTLEQEIQKLRREREQLEEQKDTEVSVMARNKQEHLEMELVRYKQQVSSLQDRLDAVTKEFDMSVEDLSETLLQIKAFRMQQESQAGLSFLCTEGNTEDSLWDLATIRASHAETVLELQKTRQLLLLEHHISQDLQEELKIVTQKMEKEREESQRKVAAKDKLLSKRALHINTLQAQLKEMAYNPRKSRPTVPIQYTWPAEEQDVMPSEDETPFTQLRAGESLLEIHLKAATFTPAGLRVMRSIHPGGNEGDDILTFCTYSFLDFEMHSTPVVSGGQPSYSFTSRYALTTRDLCRLEGQGFRMRLELHQGLGGVRFVTHGSGQISLMGTMERPGERISGRVSISGSEGETVGVVDYWVRLFSPAVPIDAVVKTAGGTAVQRRAEPGCLGWQDTGHKELYDYGGGIPNELVIMLEHCVGLSTRWPGLFPDAYLTYRFYDLPPHVSQTARCSADPVFNDSASYSLAVTADVLRYLRSSSLWVYVFDESDEQIPPPYLAKTPIPLGALATGREVKGDYVLRDPAGSPRGVVRVTMRWKYPFQPSVDAVLGKEDGVMDSSEREERRGEREASHKPVAKPRVKTQTLKRESREGRKGSKPAPPPVKQKSLPSIQPEQPATKKRSAAPSRPLTRKPSEVTSSRQSPVTLSRRSSASGVTTQDLPSGDQVSQDEEKEERSESANSDAPETSDSSDIVIPSKQMRQGDKLRVEILSLTFEPSSRVALDKSVQRVYVEYRLLGVPMETTETPMSLRKPKKGEEIHYNFTRVIYVDGSQSTSLRRYLYTMLEGSDPNQGRLKFTVVSEPMDEDEECVDVGHAFLDLKDLLLTGNDVIEQQIDIVSLDEDKEVIGNLKVSLEAAKALTGIYQEFHQKSENQEEEDTSDEREEEEEKQKMKEVMQLIDYDDDSDL